MSRVIKSNYAEQLKKIQSKYETTLDSDLDKVATDIYIRARRNVPVVTGRLKRSITKEKVSKLDYKVSANTPYDWYVEYGTNRFVGRYYMFDAYSQSQQALLKLVNSQIKKG